MFLAWSDEDQEKALAWLIEQRSRCPNGHPWDLSEDPNQKWEPVMDRCVPCEKAQEHMQILRESEGSVLGLYVSVEPI